MTQAAIAHSRSIDSVIAGKSLGLQISEKLDSYPDVVIVFASSIYDQAALLHAVKQYCHPKYLVGCSSAGEFTSQTVGNGLACAAAIHSDEMHFSVGVGHNLCKDPNQAAQNVFSSFQGARQPYYTYRTVLIMVDGLCGSADTFLEKLTLLTNGAYQFFGCGAGDAGAFRYTPVFCDSRVLSDTVVTLEILSYKPIGIGFQQDWTPSTAPMLVTSTNGTWIKTIDGQPAIEIFRKHAYLTEQPFNVDSPLHFLVSNAIGIDTGGGYKLRVPVSIKEDGSIFCPSAVPSNTSICLMNTTEASEVESAASSAKIALQRIYDNKPALALFFDCPSSYIRMGDQYMRRLKAVQSAIPNVPYAGCNAYGQIVRAEDQRACFHNGLPAVCVIPE